MESKYIDTDQKKKQINITVKFLASIKGYVTSQTRSNTNFFLTSYTIKFGVSLPCTIKYCVSMLCIIKYSVSMSCIIKYCVSMLCIIKYSVSLQDGIVTMQCYKFCPFVSYYNNVIKNTSLICCFLH